jgi:hypothetical protein
VKRKPRPNGKFITLRDAEREYGLSYHLLYGWVVEGRIARLGESSAAPSSSSAQTSKRSSRAT